VLAAAIRASGLRAPRTLRAPQVIQKTPRSNAVIENALRCAIKKLGGRVKEMRQGVETGKDWMEFDIEYDG
jgi:hypothetical protein